MKDTIYLPTKSLYFESSVKEQYQKMGIESLSFDENELECECILPEGWKLKYTDHSMYKNLVDDNGFIRASIFDKSTYYEKKTDISFKTRYSLHVINYLTTKEKGHYETVKRKVKVKPDYYNDSFYDFMYNHVIVPEYIEKTIEEEVWVSKYKNFYDEQYNTPHYVEITDNEEIIFTTKETPKFFTEKHTLECHMEWHNNREKFEESIRHEAIEYLNKNFPKWKDINEYWSN